MYVRQSDRNIIAAATEGQIKLGRLGFQQVPGRLIAIADGLLDEVAVQLGDAVGAIDEEGVEATQARIDMEEAEDLMEISYGDLYDGLVITHRSRRLGSRGRSPDHMEELNLYLEGNNPSGFAERARADKLPIMERALEYLDEYMIDGLVPDDIIDEARQNHQAFDDAYQTFVAEEADVTDARNVADTVRRKCRSKYIAARDVVAAALRLSDVERPLAEYLPGYHDILRGNYTPSDEADEDASEPSTDDEPVEA